MENQSEKISPQESISIITEMIEQTRFNVNQSSFHLIFWGILISVIGISNFVLITIGMEDVGWVVWGLTIPGAVVSVIYGMLSGRKSKISTYADVIYAVVWTSFAVVLFTGIFFIVTQKIQGSTVAWFAMLMAGYATFLSGYILKFNALKIGGIVFFVSAWIIFFVGGSISLLISSIAVIFGYLIPGILLKKRG